jgi:hypothetical protein
MLLPCDKPCSRCNMQACLVRTAEHGQCLVRRGMGLHGYANMPVSKSMLEPDGSYG